MALHKAQGLATAQGVDLTGPDEIPFEAQQEMAQAYDELTTELARIDETRLPIVNEIVDRKVASGEVEAAHSNKAPDGLSREERKAWSATARAQRGPTRPGQTVVRRGSATWTQLIRVDLADDSRLAPLANQTATAEAAFLARVRSALSTQR